MLAYSARYYFTSNLIVQIYRLQKCTRILYDEVKEELFIVTGLVYAASICYSLWLTSWLLWRLELLGCLAGAALSIAHLAIPGAATLLSRHYIVLSGGTHSVA
jgi:hypothetical protein